RLDQRVEGMAVSCVREGVRQYGPIVAVRTAGSPELAAAMVAAGPATAVRNSSDAYGEAETRAKELKLGLWSSSFDEPAKWHTAHPERQPREQRTVQDAAPAPSRVTRDSLGRCAIKGNHSRRGEWIYHLPGQPYY